SFDTDAFLDQSLELFWKRGFAATSMADISQATGLGSGSIYAFVEDKDDLFRRVFERYGSMFRASFQTSVEGADALEQWMAWLANYLADDPDR
ncbi:helix-turn-helix domain-containing protein, partial [Acinetobacter baumannii]